MESLVLFDSVVNSRWFMRTSIILFLNKVDLFKAKLARSPLGNYFPDYSGGNDVNRAAKYLLWRFNQVNRAHLNLYPQYVGPAIHAIHMLTHQSHTSDRYLEHSSGLRCCQGNNTAKRIKRLWYPIVTRPHPSIAVHTAYSLPPPLHNTRALTITIRSCHSHAHFRPTDDSGSGGKDIHCLYPFIQSAALELSLAFILRFPGDTFWTFSSFYHHSILLWNGSLFVRRTGMQTILSQGGNRTGFLEPSSSCCLAPLAGFCMSLLARGLLNSREKKLIVRS
jgi:hypothetical protein